MKPAPSPQEIHDFALACGFADCGIIPVSDLGDYAGRIAERFDLFPAMRGSFAWLEGMAWPQQRFPWAQSVVVCVGWYGSYRLPPSLQNRVGKAYQMDPRPEPRADMHQASLRFDAFLRETGWRVAGAGDGALVPARWAAMRAGLGIIRKNNFLCTDRGSWLWLEAWLVDAERELKKVSAAKPCPDDCGLCQKACPTGAMTAPHAMDATRCVNTLTTGRSADADHPLRHQSRGWVYGCDACQDACPFNKDAWTEEADFPGLAEMAELFSLENIVDLDHHPELRGMLAKRLFYLSPEDAWKWKTNALLAMRNEWSETYRSCVERACRDENEQVRAAARAVLAAVESPV